MNLELSMYNEDVKRNQKGIVFIPILIIVILLGIAGYFAYQNYQTKNQVNNIQPTPKPHPDEKFIESWNFYESERLKIKFKNPGDMVLETTIEDFYPDQGHIELYDQSTYKAIERVNEEGGYLTSLPVIGITAFNVKGNISLLDWLKANDSKVNYHDLHTETSVAGIPALFYESVGYGMCDSKATVFFVPEKKKVYVVSLGCDDVGLDQEYNNLLESLELLP